MTATGAPHPRPTAWHPKPPAPSCHTFSTRMHLRCKGAGCQIAAAHAASSAGPHGGHPTYVTLPHELLHDGHVAKQVCMCFPQIMQLLTKGKSSASHHLSLQNTKHRSCHINPSPTAKITRQAMAPRTEAQQAFHELGTHWQHGDGSVT